MGARGSLAHLRASLFHRMIPKEQKGPVVTAMGDLTEPGKVGPALVRSPNPVLSVPEGSHSGLPAPGLDKQV